MPKFYRFPFASASPGDRADIPDINPGDGAVNYESGFTGDYELDLTTDPNAKPIPRLQTNGFYYDVTDNLRQYQTHGVPEFITTADNGGVAFPYAKYARVRYESPPGTFRIYESRLDTNTALPTVATAWTIISDNTGGVPVSAVIDFPTATPPAGFLVCQGQAVLRADYPDLFAVIGLTWGPGNGTTNFILPDLRRRGRIGAGGTAANGMPNTVGSYGGVEAELITISHIPNHTHDPDGPFSFDVFGPNGGVYTGGNTGQSRTRTGGITGYTTQDPFAKYAPGAVMLPCIKF